MPRVIHGPYKTTIISPVVYKVREGGGKSSAVVLINRSSGS